MTNSLWTQTAKLPEFPQLQGDRKADVLVIGGGIAGILCAKVLQDAGVDVVLAEANRICSGITKDTTAKITAQHGLLYHKLLKKFGRELASLYLNANLNAVEEYQKLCKTIPCSFENRDSFVYATRHKELELEYRALEQLGYPADFLSSVPMPLKAVGAVRFRRQGQFHPLNFLSHIARELEIYEQTPIRALEGNTAISDQGNIQAEKIIVATHFPFLNTHGSYFLKLYQQRSYVLALQNAPTPGGMYIGDAENSLSFREHKGLLLLGGGGHRTGKPGGGWAALEGFAQRHYPGAKPLFHWATQDCMTLDGLPYIGRYSKNTPNLYVITGFNKWGMTNAMAGAHLLRDLLLGHRNPYAQVVSPSRSMLQPQLLINAAEATGNLLRFSEKRCPHLGCALKWNPQEHSWDCPCHGSRFTAEGKLIDNPATGDLPPS